MIIIFLLKAIPLSGGISHIIRLSGHPSAGRFGAARFHDLLILSLLYTSLFEKEMLD
tara:strand:+ start:2340 stop:2510 length:171 start_codon:yes stop_codon:yes gene_type:complete